MDWIKGIFSSKRADAAADLREYAPLTEEPHTLEGSTDGEGETFESGVPFSWLEYSIFALIGVAMLWAWNMFLAAAPYFHWRLIANDWIAANFQSAILSVSTITNLLAMLVLTNIQYTADYPWRIRTALWINGGVFTLLTASTVLFADANPGPYLFFLLVMVAATAWAAGLLQNGAFAFAASFGRPEYTQAIMAGQGVAGVLPPLAQVFSVLVVPEGGGGEGGGPADEAGSGSPPPPPPPSGGPGTAAFLYFLAAVFVSAVAILAFVPLVRRHDRIVRERAAEQLAESWHSIQEAEQAHRRVVGLPTLLRKLHWLAAAVFACFVVTMFFPVLTAKVVSVRAPEPRPPRLLEPPAFIPLGFFFWNLGDLAGRCSTLVPALSAAGRLHPALLLGAAAARVGFIPLYLLCNVGGRGAAVPSDAFYLLAVQLPFGLTNGWLSSNAMMAAGLYVEEAEREAAGGFMGLCLVAGLAVGSVLSFTVAGV